MRMGKKIFGITITLIFVCFVLFLFVLIYGYVSFSERSERGNNVYRLREYDVSTDRSNSMSIMISRYLEDGEYIYYEQKPSHFLISNFEDKEYKCTGRCVCVKRDDRRSMAISTRGIFYLIAASGIVVAHQRAKQYFSDECQNRETDSFCSDPSHTVLSEYDDCEPIENTGKGPGELRKDPKKVEEREAFRKEGILVEEDEGKMEHAVLYRFTCHGNCKPIYVEDKRFDFLPKEWEVFNRQQKKQKCHEMDFNNIIDARVGDFVEQMEPILESGDGGFGDAKESAMMHFILEDLHPFCTDNSVLIPSSDITPDKKGMSVCAGFDTKLVEEMESPFKEEDELYMAKDLNPTIRCEKLELSDQAPESPDILYKPRLE